MGVLPITLIRFGILDISNCHLPFFLLAAIET